VEWHISPIKRKLDECGYETHRFHPLGNGWGDITANTHKLAVEAGEYSQQGREVFLIGHSMGGLIAKEATDVVDVQGIVTIATPHRGTQLAMLAPWSESARQMTPGSEYIKGNMAFPTMCPMLNIACRYDELVVPRGNAVHPSADFVEWMTHDHLTVMFSRKVANVIVNYLKSWTFT
jgi:pimeloyl-ACP methyl ester carboxylesterase